MSGVSGNKPPRRRRGPANNVFAPAAEAHRLRGSGLDWSEVAGLTGYPSGVAAKAAVFAWMQEAAITESTEQRAQAYAEEVARLDRLQKEWWDAAVGAPGVDRDLDAARFVLQIIQVRARLRQLDKPQLVETAGEVLVIHGSEEEYVAAMKAIAEAS